jgi:RNA polymerase sigma factor (sigma-70 family)
MPEAFRRPAGRQPTAPACNVVSIDAGGRRERVLARRDELVTEHLGMVKSIARSLLPPEHLLDDLVGVGNIALIAAATRYRPSAHRDTPFSAYARQRVRGAMLDLLRDHQNGIGAADVETGEIAAEAKEPEVSIDRGRMWKRIHAAVAQLPPKQRELLEAYYGPQEPSLAIVAGRMRVSPQRASQIHARAIDGLRDLLRVAL